MADRSEELQDMWGGGGAGEYIEGWGGGGIVAFLIP